MGRGACPAYFLFAIHQDDKNLHELWDVNAK